MTSKPKRYHYITPEDYAIAERNGISKRTLNDRVRRYGMDVDTAISKPLKVCAVFEATWQKYRDTCEAHGISRKLFYQRLYHKMSEELASTRPIKRGNIF